LVELNVSPARPSQAPGAPAARLPGAAMPEGIVVIPALNEERAIRTVVQDALARCGRVIVVDDGSSDGTSAAIADLPVERIRHEQPLG